MSNKGLDMKSDKNSVFKPFFDYVDSL